MNQSRFFDLTDYNTFKVSAKARYFTTINTVTDLINIHQYTKPLLVLGGGSNLLFVDDFEGTVIHNRISGITLIKEDAEYAYLKVGAGENWHDFVMYTLSHNWFGLENLSLIPGTVGAAPVQNIGAYGVEVSQYIESVDVYNIDTASFETLSNAECLLSYRDSIFKHRDSLGHPAQSYRCITFVYFKLNKLPKLNLKYQSVNERLAQLQLDQPSPQDLAHVIMQIRRDKLPDPKVIPNAGSFFKNPLVTKIEYETLLHTYPELVCFEFNETHVKLAAGQLIELVGFKGKQIGNVAMYAKQALVLTNCGGATGRELWDYAMQVKAMVHRKFSVNINPEPLILMNRPL